MAYCKHVGRLAIQSGSEFDRIHGAGGIAPLSGVYACEGCGRSVLARNGGHLPAADHHGHADGRPIAWRLVVRSHWS